MECTFRMEPNIACRLDAGGDGLCIFHVAKTAPGSKASLGEIRNWQAMNNDCRTELFKLIEKLEADPEVLEYDFQGFQINLLELPTVIKKPINLHKSRFGMISLNGIEFRGKVNFTHCVCESAADLSKSVFCEGVDFSGMKFLYSTLFFESRFDAEAKFWFTEFKNVWFRESNFSSADFLLAEVKDSTRFTSCTFKGVANFARMKFGGEADFSGSTFNTASTFTAAEFRGITNFGKTELGVYSSFSNAVFLARSRFQEAVFKNAFFNALDLGKDSDVVFETVDLSRATFLDSNLEQIGFRDIKWHRQKSNPFSMRRLNSLWDEFRQSSELDTDFERIAENYRQLVLIYERKRDFETAEDFHIGEMEMRRKKKGVGSKAAWLRRLREWTNAYSLYRWSSGYGTSYIQGLIVLLLMMGLFALAFLYSGFQEVSDTGHGERVIEYNLFADFTHRPVPFRQWGADLVSAFSLCASIITFQKDRFYEPLPGIARLWLYIAILVITSQAALVLFAVRRRFKR